MCVLCINPVIWNMKYYFTQVLHEETISVTWSICECVFVRNCDKSTLQSKASNLSFSLELGYFVTLLVTTQGYDFSVLTIIIFIFY
jgi:hypothetical protein